MLHSIQENVKKINSHITVAVIASLLTTAVLLVGFAVYLERQAEFRSSGVTYTAGDVQGAPVPTEPFGAVNSPVYTYAWCQGADKIKPANRVYFRDADDAERRGRTLSKLCER